VDAFGHPYFPGVGSALAQQLSARLGLRARYDKPGTLARMAMHAVSEVDLAEAEACGRRAVELALAGTSGVMVAIQRVSDDPYAVSFTSAPLAAVANHERKLPDAMLGQAGDTLTPAFRRYALPLLGEPIAAYESLA
jgi:6-phosphofructokinase 1